MAMVTALAAVVWGVASPTDARSSNPFGSLFQDFSVPRRAKSRAVSIVPLPKPRPADAPGFAEPPRERAQPLPFPAPLPVPLPENRPAQVEPSPSPQLAAPAAPQPSPCRAALSDQIAIAPSIPDITGPGTCGGTDLVRLEAVIMPGKDKVPLKPAATLRCEMAMAVAGWLRDDMAPLAISLGTSIAELDNFDSFDCRGRNRVKGAKMSEHGRANALDLRGLKFANGQFVSLTEASAPRDVREKVLQSVCARFSTVLGPGSDGYHEDHIHLDLAERRSGYRICQWAIYEPMPNIAPLLPAERPADAPPRAVADADTRGQTQQPATPAPGSNAEEAEPEQAAPPPKSVQKRRSRQRAARPF